MALLRSAAPLLRCARLSPASKPLSIPPSTLSTLSTPLTRRALCTTTPRRGGHGNDSPWDSPGGWLWGVKPGEKAEAEGWEWPMYIFAGSLVATGIALAFKPDTSVSTWALEEARRRLEAEGVLPDPENKKD